MEAIGNKICSFELCIALDLQRLLPVQAVLVSRNSVWKVNIKIYFGATI